MVLPVELLGSAVPCTILASRGPSSLMLAGVDFSTRDEVHAAAGLLISLSQFTWSYAVGRVEVGHPPVEPLTGLTRESVGCAVEGEDRMINI